MAFHLSVLARSAELEARWAKELSLALRGVVDIEVTGRSPEPAQILFLDGGMTGLEERLSGLDRRGKAVFLILEETSGSQVPQALAEGRVDDVLVAPFRPLEVLSKIRHYQQILMWDEVTRLNASFSELLSQLHEDLRIAERLQKGRLPARFPEVKGFQVASRYLAGMKSGGDHFDLAESKDGSLLNILLSDSSSYGLSSALLSILMKVTLKMSGQELRSTAETVARIREELLLVLGDKDRLSLFYGTISRKDYRLRYLNLGDSRAFYAPPRGEFRELAGMGTPLSRAAANLVFKEAEVALEPGSRLVLLSDGFLDVIGSSADAAKVLARFRTHDPLESLNELVFQVKSKFAEPDEMPAQDCSALVLDVDSKILRLA